MISVRPRHCHIAVHGAASVVSPPPAPEGNGKVVDVRATHVPNVFGTWCADTTLRRGRRRKIVVARGETTVSGALGNYLRASN